MKHLLTLFSLLVIATSYGQKKERKKNRKKNKGEITYHMDYGYLERYFKGLDSIQAETNILEISKIPKREFIKNEWRFPSGADNSYFSFFRKDTTTEEDEGKKWETSIKFKISNRIVGENKSLEISGKKVYDIEYITGKYKDVFYIWQKYFRNDTTLEGLLQDKEKTESYLDINYMPFAEFRHHYNTGLWSIDLHRMGWPE